MEEKVARIETLNAVSDQKSQFPDTPYFISSRYCTMLRRIFDITQKKGIVTPVSKALGGDACQIFEL